MVKIVLKNHEMLEFILDHLKSNKMRKHAVKNGLIC